MPLKIRIKNYLELCKPRITFFCLMMTGGGMILAHHKISLISVLATFVATAFSVASANTYNMVYERHSDKFMKRTQFRPMVVGKISVLNALMFATILAILSLLIFGFFVNILTAGLSLFALIFYAAIYTPLKARTPLALVIGAIPGAMPPLLGWTAADNKLTLPALALFSVLFAWQMPHFIAISLMHKKDYASAGIKVIPVVRGDDNAKIQSVLWSLCLFVFSLSLVYFKLGSIIYTVFAVTLGVIFVYMSIVGITKPTPAWPRNFFFASLLYLPILIIGLIVDRSYLFFFT